MKHRLITCVAVILLLKSADIPLTADSGAPSRNFTFEDAEKCVRSEQRSIGNLNLNDLQVALRLSKLLWETEYKFKSADLPKWKALLERPGENEYARLCAVYFLIDTDAGARQLLEQEMNSADLRHRYNAAKILIEVNEETAPPEVKSWEIDLMIRHLNDGSLDQGPRQDFQAAGTPFPDGDGDDINNSPVDEFCYRLGTLKVVEASPAIVAYLKRVKDKNPLIVDSLGDIGDPQAIPFLLELLKDGNTSAYALGKLKCREAVPMLLTKLSANDDPSIHYFQGPDDVILRALRDIGDAQAIPRLREYLQGKRAEQNKATARRVLIELSSPDPAKELIAQFDQETDELTRGDIVSDLANLYPEPRTVTALASISGTSDSAFLRQRALYGLGQIHTKAALAALTRLLTMPFPENLTTKWGFKGLPKNFTGYFHDDIADQLRDATHQNFGLDAVKWQQWIDASPLP